MSERRLFEIRMVVAAFIGALCGFTGGIVLGTPGAFFCMVGSVIFYALLSTYTLREH